MDLVQKSGDTGGKNDRHCSNATILVNKLANHNKIKRVIYPFHESHVAVDVAKKQMKQGGGIVSFELNGGVEEGRQFLNSLKMCSMSPNLGDTRTIVTHPASTTHSKLTAEQRLSVGITDALIRVSVGLEHIEDISGDILQALGGKMV